MNNRIIKSAILAGTAAVAAMTISPAFARQGADDPAGHVRQARGADDAVGHVRQEDRAATASTSRADNAAADIRQARGADDAPGDVRRGRGRDDPRPHN
jgi:hypothetical protein